MTPSVGNSRMWSCVLVLASLAPPSALASLSSSPSGAASAAGGAGGARAAEELDEGRRQYETALQNARAPRFGACWTGALARLDVGCRALTDDRQVNLQQ